VAAPRILSPRTLVWDLNDTARVLKEASRSRSTSSALIDAGRLCQRFVDQQRRQKNADSHSAYLQAHTGPASSPSTDASINDLRLLRITMHLSHWLIKAASADLSDVRLRVIRKWLHEAASVACELDAEGIRIAKERLSSDFSS